MKFELLQTAHTGHGKTRRTLTATRFGKLFVFDFDGKLEAAMRTMKPEDRELVTHTNLKEKDYDFALSELKKLKALTPFPYATVAIDTFTMLNEKIFVQAMGGKLEKGTKADYDIWGMVDNKLLNFFNLLMTLPCNIIINAHVAVTENPDGRESLAPAGRGGFRNRIAPRMTDAHYLYLRDGKYQIRARNSESVPANSNFPESFYDAQGNLKVADLSVFDEYAYKVK
jgi:AAA domain-containing protein